MDLKLTGHNVIITGGTKGIGRAIAETLAEEGCNIAICARNADDVSSAVASLSAKGVKVTGQALDVADGDAFAAWINSVGEELGGIDAFVSNVSGGNAPGDAGWISQFNYNILSAVHGGGFVGSPPAPVKIFLRFARSIESIYVLLTVFL